MYDTQLNIVVYIGYFSVYWIHFLHFVKVCSICLHFVCCIRFHMANSYMWCIWHLLPGSEFLLSVQRRTLWWFLAIFDTVKVFFFAYITRNSERFRFWSDDRISQPVYLPLMHGEELHCIIELGCLVLAFHPGRAWDRDRWNPALRSWCCGPCF